MLRDLVRDNRKVYSYLDTVALPNNRTLVNEVMDGNLPSWEHWYWNRYEKAPCYVMGDEVYCMSYDTVGEFYLLGTMEDLEEEASHRIQLGPWGKERLKYLNDHKYGVAFGMLCRGELWEHCKEVEEEANDRQFNMVLERMRPYEALKDKDVFEYCRIFNNETESVKEIIRKELIYS